VETRGLLGAPVLRFIVLASLTGPWLLGCAAMPGGAPQPVLISDPSDGCRLERNEFATSQIFFARQIVANVAGGAILGGALGAGAGLLTGMNPLKAGAIGAALGGAAGGVSGYSTIMAEKSRDQLEMLSSVNQDLAREGQEIDHASASFARLRACRFGAATFIKTQVRRRVMDRATAMQQLDQQRRLFAEEIAVAKTYQISMDKRNAEFQDAANTIRQQAQSDAGSAQRAAAQTAAAQTAAAQTANTQAQAVRQAAGVSIPNKRSSYERSIASAETSSEIAFSLDNNKKVSSLALIPRA